MTCIKTGFNGYIVPYNEFVHGDLYQTGDVYYMRINQRYMKKPDWMDRQHIVVTDFAEWFDKDEEGRNSTMVASMYNCSRLNYEGEPI